MCLIVLVSEKRERNAFVSKSVKSESRKKKSAVLRQCPCRPAARRPQKPIPVTHTCQTLSTDLPHLDRFTTSNSQQFDSNDSEMVHLHSEGSIICALWPCCSPRILISGKVAHRSETPIVPRFITLVVREPSRRPPSRQINDQVKCCKPTLVSSLIRQEEGTGTYIDQTEHCIPLPPFPKYSPPPPGNSHSVPSTEICPDSRSSHSCCYL